MSFRQGCVGGPAGTVRASWLECWTTIERGNRKGSGSAPGIISRSTLSLLFAIAAVAPPWHDENSIIAARRHEFLRRQLTVSAASAASAACVLGAFAASVVADRAIVAEPGAEPRVASPRADDASSPLGGRQRRPRFISRRATSLLLRLDSRSRFMGRSSLHLALGSAAPASKH